MNIICHVCSIIFLSLLSYTIYNSIYYLYYPIVSCNKKRKLSDDVFVNTDHDDHDALISMDTEFRHYVDDDVDANNIKKLSLSTTESTADDEVII